MRNKFNQQGSTLLFALLLLFAMTAIAFAIAAISWREINLARHIDDATQAFYAAESGLERGLDVIRAERRTGTLFETAVDKVRNINNISLSTLPQTKYSLVDSKIGITETIFPYMNIGDNYAGAQIEMYNPDDPFAAAGTVAKSVTIFWSENGGNDCAKDGSQIELSYFGIAAAANDREIDKTLLNCSTSSTEVYNCTATSNAPASFTNFILRLKPINCNFTNVKVVFYNASDGSGNVVDIPSRYELVAAGTGRFSQRRMKATAKWTESAQQLVDFVLFSVEKIEKL